MLTLNFTRLPTFNPRDRNGNASNNLGWRVYFDNAPIGVIPAGASLPHQIGQIAEDDYGDHQIHLAPVNSVGEGNQIGPKVVTNPRPAPALPGNATGDFDVRLSLSGGNNTGSGAGYDPGSPLFFDDFDYTVTDDAGDATANTAAFEAAGWNRLKAINLGQSNAAGNISTALVSSIPGYSGPAPGSSLRALRINSLAGTLASQTDIYVGMGSLSDPDFIPANVWFQFWYYPCRSGAELTGFHSREKFIYPSLISGTNTNHPRWLWQLTTQPYPPLQEGFSETSGNAYALMRDADDNPPDNQAVPDYEQSHLGVTSAAEYLAVNRWTQVRIHFDTGSAQGSYECWMRPYGGEWTKVADWVGGVTPNFVWPHSEAQRGGHYSFVMPSTFPGPGSNDPTHDAYIYMQDFAMAGDVSDLPTYGGY